jgi:hypothetical protein
VFLAPTSAAKALSKAREIRMMSGKFLNWEIAFLLNPEASFRLVPGRKFF